MAGRRRFSLALAAILLFTALDAAALRQRGVRHPSFTELDVPALEIFQRARDRYADHVEAQVETILNPGSSNAATG